MPNFRSIFWLIVAILFSSWHFSFASLTHAVDYTETFNNALSNPLFWQSTRGDLIFATDVTREYGSMQVANGINPYHYYKSVDFFSLKPDYSSVTFTVKFSSNSISQGAGYILSDNVPSESSPLLFSTYMFYVWPKPNGTFHIFSSLCPESNPGCSVSSQLANGVYAMPTDGAWHDITLRRALSHYEWLVDDLIVFTTVDTARIISSIGIGDPENTSGFLIWPSLYIDFIGLDTSPPSPSPAPSPSIVPSPSPSAVPSPSPSLSPSPSPSVAPSGSPTPSISPLPSGYPYYSQKDPLWASQDYDHAQLWASAGKRGIDRWGCALTSAAMVLKNYGVRAVSGIETTPAVLNTWLRIQSDGYLRNGLLNWLAVSRYTHQSRLAGKSPTELEFSKKIFSAPEVDAQIASGTAPILSLPGHFELAHSDLGTHYGIHDPLDPSNTFLPKTDPILTSNVFVPSLTDLSYMLYAYDPGMTITVKDTTGSAVSGIETEEWLKDDILGTEGAHLKLLYVPKPLTGNYVLEVENPTVKSGKVDIYFYDTKGSVWVKKISVAKETEVDFDLKYDRSKVSKNKMDHNWKWVWHYVKKWKRWERVRDFWNHHNQWGWRD